MAERVRITDVSPRDGLQNEAGTIPTAEKVRLVELLCAAAVDEVEVSSFVSPRWVPQLGDAAEVFAGLQRMGKAGNGGGRPVFSALVPNEQGMAGLLAVNSCAGFGLVDKVCLFTAASETFSKRNTNASIDDSIARFTPVLRAAYGQGLAIKLYVSCAFGCPFEGEVAARRVAGVVAMCLGAAAHSTVWADQPDAPGFSSVEVSLGDTIGMATPGKMRVLLDACGPRNKELESFWAEHPGAMLNLHLHDTFGRAADCVKAGLDGGVRSFDGSVAGLGGCPYASKPGKPAPGNISTEALVRVVQGAGFETGVKVGELERAGAYAREAVGRSRQGSGGPGAAAGGASR